MVRRKAKVLQGGQQRNGAVIEVMKKVVGMSKLYQTSRIVNPVLAPAGISI